MEIGSGADFAGGGPHHGGRYLGIGTYPAGQFWKQIVRQDPPKDSQAATLADDEQIIAIVDARTGEVRQCGNLSGYCVSSNPWKAAAAPAPTALAKHAADLAKERDQTIRANIESRKD